jgi:hypothetical protein
MSYAKLHYDLDHNTFVCFHRCVAKVLVTVVTEVPPEDMDNPLADQRHGPLAFISGAFKGASSRWPIIEKEAFAIVETTDRWTIFFCTPMDPVYFVITGIYTMNLTR